MAPTARTSKPKRSPAKRRANRLRAQGLRPIVIWVPDVHSPAFLAEAHRQSLAVSAGAHAQEDQAFIDAVSIWPNE